MKEQKIPSNYYSERPEVTALVPANVQSVIDIGCGSGVMGSALKRMRPNIEVRGIEPHGPSAEQARIVLDDVSRGSADDPPPAGWPQPDCLIFADVLEHMVDPWTCLATWRQHLATGGRVILSIPNIAHYSTVRGLMRGRWDYQEEGILDRTHLRFFTRGTAIALVQGAGFTIESFARNWRMPNGLHSTSPWVDWWDHVGWPKDSPIPPPGTRMADYVTVQYLIVASR